MNKKFLSLLHTTFNTLFVRQPYIPSPPFVLLDHCSLLRFARDLTMSVAISAPNSTASQRGGKLFDLPPELRDQIYRYIVKGTYVDPGCQHSLPTTIKGHRSANFGIVFASKAISDETLALLYSESTFLIRLQPTEKEPEGVPPKRVSQRMMNIELDVTPRDDTTLNTKKNIWKETLRCVNRTNTIRNTLRIRCRPCPSDISNPVPEWMYRGLQSLTRFRTVIVELPRDVYFRSENYPRIESEHILEELEHRMEAIEGHLKHAFGPAAIKPRYGCGYRWQARTLTFHPQAHHLSKKSRVLRNG